MKYHKKLIVKMSESVQSKIEEYVNEKYPKIFKGKQVFIQEGNVFLVSNHKDGSPFPLLKTTFGV